MSPGLGLSPGTALGALLVVNVVALSGVGMTRVAVAAAVVFCALATLRRPRLFWGGLAFVAGSMALYLVPVHLEVSSAVGLVAVLGFWTSRFALALLAGSYVLLTVQPSELSALLYRMRCPRWLTIPLTVMLRFFPTAKQEFVAIFEAMSLRGIPIGPGAWFAHPLRSIEYLLVPMLVSCSRIADDLAASVLVRGLGSQARPTPLRSLGFRGVDAATIVVLIGLVAFSMWAPEVLS